MKSTEWLSKLQAMIPSYGKTLSDNPELIHKVRSWTSSVLHLNPKIVA
jgi:malate dehydrogenase (quinone)